MSELTKYQIRYKAETWLDIDNDGIYIGDRVVSITPIGNKYIEFEELCDNCFGAFLNKTQMKLLIEELQKYYNNMVDEE